MMPRTEFRDPISWPLLPYPKGGQLAYPNLEKSVRDSIRILLTTRPGEQLMRPQFGAGLETFLDEGNTVAVRRQIQTAILENLQKYETRIALDRVDVDNVINAPSEVRVQICYRLLRTNSVQQLGLTVQLG
jgi:phage baseplate assembly protein W